MWLDEVRGGFIWGSVAEVGLFLGNDFLLN